ncbi:ferrochelatase [Legionella hackeliae]|uniref:Ferrochelatase n=1 Tax=Legionella hackeliae TaxID=449 RepID=A0A0A8UXF4_LEGHA|nr:ferrochelatase [Legionella hackeliae]KTD15201.1 ferrochelatase [Legionella hackeliae]CEK11434.1 Ferrochelatase [Legionella hackeliae]STX48206.1 ferrochelatase [Legionella hackeliae]
MTKNGLLLINLGTPDNPEPLAVRRYLREFLADKRVIDLPAPLRYLILYLIILPFRPKQSAHAYQAIWTKDGSPLLIHSRNLQSKLQQHLGEQWTVALGMRYGNPSLESALKELSNCDHITVLPLYPQFSSAASGSSIEKVLQLLSPNKVFPSLTIIRDFYKHPAFIKSQAALIQPHLETHDFILFSYHGIPERHLTQGHCKSVCDTPCPKINETNRTCYKAQCYATSYELAKQLGLSNERYTTAFQSRLGKTPWIQPYTDNILPELAQKGIKRLAVACPSFVADCLETLEEIGIRAKEQWQELGGEHFTVIPCINDSDLWVASLSEWLSN